MNATKRLHDLGQSIWLDNITRDLLDTRTLKRYVDELSVTGLTSNPTIFNQAIKGSAAYDAAIRAGLARGTSSEEIFFDLALDDVTRAADLFRPVWDRTNSVDAGCRSRCRPSSPTTRRARWRPRRRCSAARGARTFSSRFPARKEGLPAIEEAIFAGIPVNVTLLFSREHYLAAADAFLRGIERRIEAGLDPNVGSVASLFISRWMSRLPARSRGAQEPARHRRRAADLRGGASAARLAPLAAHVQLRGPSAAPPVRQHGDKGPAGLAILYVKAFAAPCTVNTMPEATLNALATRRSWAASWPTTAATARASSGSSPGRYRRRCPRGPPAGRGREVVRGVVERAHGGHRLEERRAEVSVTGQPDLTAHAR